LLQLGGGGRLPLSTDAGFIDPIALQTIVDHRGIIARRNLMRQLAGHGSLHPTVLLKGFIAFEPHLFAGLGAQTRFGDGNFASGKNDVPRLLAMPVSGLLAVRTTPLSNFLFQEMMDDLQPGLGAQRFDFGFGLEDDFQHRLIELEVHRVDVEFGAGFCQRTDVLLFHAVVGFGLFFISPPSLSARQPNHQPLFQLFKGHSLAKFIASNRNIFLSPSVGMKALLAAGSKIANDINIWSRRSVSYSVGRAYNTVIQELRRASGSGPVARPDTYTRRVDTLAAFNWPFNAAVLDGN